MKDFNNRGGSRGFGGGDKGKRGGFGGGNRGFGGGNRGGDRGGSRGGSVEMHDAVCDDCGNKCQVPFRPSNDKPIFCNGCFAGKRESDSRSFDRNDRKDDRRDFSAKPSFGGNTAPVQDKRNDDFKKQIDALNQKMDTLIQMMQGVKAPIVKEKSTEVKAPKVEIKKEVKKAAVKKVEKVTKPAKVVKATKQVKTTKGTAKKATPKKK